MADFLSSSSPIPVVSSSNPELSPNSSPSASLFQDSTKFLQHLGFLENFSGTPTTIGGFTVEAPTSSTSNISTLARNSTKTLKCPKCNWHYKYQEALENHLKDKHPDVEVTCIYCIQNLPHPKLARGETYSCGYKPFRCTICNYSTTTKGNLSIHMQSDKHLHAMQDIPTAVVPTSQGGAPQPEQSDDKCYHCLICGIFTCDSIDDLVSHLNADRSQTNVSDISSLHGIYQCYLCPYSTNLKANFQLHMRTDKHIQRVQMINHMRENILAATSPTSNLLCRLSNAKSGVQVRCRPCFEILTSTESIREHCQTSGHLTRTNFLQSNSVTSVAAAVLGLQGDESDAAIDLSMESTTADEESNYQCLKCDFHTSEEESALDHLQDHDLTNSDSPNAGLLLIDQIPEEREELSQLFEMNEARLNCNQCSNFKTDSIEEFQSHLSNHSINSEKSPETVEANRTPNDSQTIEVKCPLCDLPKEMSSLHSHLLNDHKISSDVAKKLMATNGIGNDDSTAPSTSPIYKYHCKLCPMIFRTNDGFQMHSLKHIFTSTHKCTRCNRSFKTIQSLRNHMANKHEISNFDSSSDNACSICSETFPDRQALQTHIYSIEHLHKAKKFLEQQSTGKLGQQLNEQVLSLLSKIPKNTANEPTSIKKPYKCNVCRLSYGQGSTLDIHLRSVAHQTRIGRLSELVASGEVDASQPVSEQPGGIIQKTIGELILPSTTSELEKLQRSESPMDVASTTASTATPSSTQASSRKRKLDNDAANPFAAFQNIMNMSQLFSQFTNENLENGSMDFNNALAALNSGDLQSFLTEHLTQQQPSSVHSSQASSPRASPIDEICDEPKTGKSLRHTLEADGLELIEQFFANLSSVKRNIDRIPDSEISELCKVDCPNCDTVLPSIWILKKHAKELHAVSLPLEAVQQFSEKLKQALDDLEEENQIPEAKKQKIEEITNNLKAGKLNGTSGNAKSTKKTSLSKIEENPSPSPSMDSSNLPNLAMMSMLAGSNFPMLMNPFLSMMNPEMLANAAVASQANGSSNGTNGSMTTVSSPGCGGDFSALTGQQRRARTKITDDQLKVLKQYFDISNSPTEQQVKEMAMKTGLLEKVIKHWFRNTLFKERQRDKDSPYNFNVPPQLSIDLDTYEKTGEAKIKPFKCDDNEDASNVSTPAPSTPIQMPQLEIKKEPKFAVKQEPKLSISIDPSSAAAAAAVNSQTAAFVSAASEFMANLNKACNNNTFNPFALLSQAAMGGGTPTSTDKSFSDMLACSTSLDLTSPLSSATPNGSSNGGGSGRRANRTRFTDLQLRSLQQFFDKQAYPKDDDLEMLSKKLNLSPRVIVVWFQNARQKARKIYENTPNLDNNERFVRTPGQNFQCKRCQLVFPRYYELIQHQQKVCYVNDNDAQQNDNKFVEEMMSDDEKPTTSYDNTSSATVNITTGDPLTLSSGSSHGGPSSPLPSQSTMETLNQLLNGTSNAGNYEDKDDSAKEIPLLPGSVASSEDLLKFLTGKCDNATLNKLLESSGKQQVEDFSNDLSQAPLDLSTSPTFLQDEPSSNNHSRRESSLNYLDTDFDFSTVMSSVSPTNFPSVLANTFFSSTGSGSPNQQRSPSATSISNQHGANKRYRTHLTPLQVYVMKALFNDYKTPSMTECDILGKEIGLNKRVVQVWFQNARAKERKCRSVTGDEDLPKTSNDSCSMCGIDFGSRTPKLTMQDHIFTKRHIGFLSERFNSRSTSQSSNPGRHDGSLSPPPQISEPAAPEKVRARAVRDSGSRKPSSNRPSSTNSQFPFNLMYGLQSGTLPHLMCDPSILGTPIAALQIPQAVMQQIQIDIQAGKESTKFTQDGLELKDLKAKISDDDFKCVTTVTNEVGYACPGCSYTFQQQSQLEAHQKIICQNFEGKVFKLLQIHYECIACITKTGTQDDFKKHIESTTHQQIRNLFIQPVIENFLATSAM